MEEPTMEEVLELVEFDRSKDGCLRVRMVYGNVCGSVIGNVWGDVQGCVKGDVWANVHGYVRGDVRGYVQGKISGRAWQYVETPKERAIRLIREGKGEEAIKVLEEQQ
jgi:outer membrane lipoprotein SlyB